MRISSPGSRLEFAAAPTNLPAVNLKQSAPITTIGSASMNNDDQPVPTLQARHHRPRSATANGTAHHHSAPRRNARRDKVEHEPVVVMRLHGARQGAFVIGPRSCVFSVPEGLLPNTPAADIIACPAFDPANPTTSCPLGPRCHFVHVDTAQLRDHPIHVNYAWRSLEDVTYDRYPAGHRLEVAPPNLAVTADVMDSSLALKTKALAASRRQLSHCAHYYFNRTCNLGSDCRFVHAVFIDPGAKDHQRAPAPVQLGRVSLAVEAAPVILLPHPAAPQPVIGNPTAVVALGGASFSTQPHQQQQHSTGGLDAPDVSAAASTQATSSAAGLSRRNSNSAVLHAQQGVPQAHPPRQHRPYEATPLPAPSTTTSGDSTTSSSTVRGSPVTSPDVKRTRNNHDTPSATVEQQPATQQH